MNKYSKRSREALSTCHPDLQRLFEAVLPWFDHSILEGHRGEHEQNQAVLNKRSTLEWPDSEHNKLPSLAVDVMPYPINWSDIKRIEDFARVVKCIAHSLEINIKWGGDWDTFVDMPHWELEK